MHKDYDLERLRRLVVVAFASDDELSEALVFKGGNALRLVHGVGNRASLDLDYSMQGEFDDVQGACARMTSALVRTFAAEGLTPFDIKLAVKPRLNHEDLDPAWGGYQLSFKVLDSEVFLQLEDRPEKRRQFAAKGYGAKKDFRVDVSKFEYCDGATIVEFETYDLRVYPLPMIAAEKLRALCQQMPAYTRNATSKSARARDFYDLCAIADDGCALLDHTDVVRAVFDAKEVPLELLSDLEGQREFHRSDWNGVVATLGADADQYDAYFDRVVELASALAVELLG